MGIRVAARLIMTAILARNGCEARLLGSKTAVRGGFGVRWCGSIGHLANVSFPTSGWYELGSPEGEPGKPQERDEFAKHQKLEAINARLAQHHRKVADHSAPRRHPECRDPRPAGLPTPRPQLSTGCSSFRTDDSAKSRGRNSSATRTLFQQSTGQLWETPCLASTFTSAAKMEV
jgi:hypothetical protein